MNCEVQSERTCIETPFNCDCSFFGAISCCCQFGCSCLHLDVCGLTSFWIASNYPLVCLISLTVLGFLSNHQCFFFVNVFKCMCKCFHLIEVGFHGLRFPKMTTTQRIKPFDLGNSMTFFPTPNLG